jgi:hypothetical protein
MHARASAAAARIALLLPSLALLASLALAS